MSITVPDQINHRRRVLYAALTEVLRDRTRVDTIFELCDPLVREEHFLASRITEYVMRTGLLQGEERIPLTRTLMQVMRLKYTELPKFPNDLVIRTEGGKLTQELGKTRIAAAAAKAAHPTGEDILQATKAAGSNQTIPSVALEAPDLRSLQPAKHVTILDVDPISLKRVDSKQQNPLFPKSNSKKPKKTSGWASLLSFLSFDLGKLIQRRSKQTQYAPVRISRNNTGIHLPPPSAKVFRTVVGAVVESIQETAPHFDRMIIEIAQQGQHSGMIKPVLEPWLDAGLAPPALAGSLNLTQMRGIINILYLCACQLVGPLEADRLIGAAILQAEGLPEAEDFAPRQLF